MRKRKLRRRLRECRETLDAAVARDPGAFGICMPVELRSTECRSDGSVGIRYATPEPDPHGTVEYWRERATTEQVARRHAEETRDAYARGKERAETKLRDAQRHLDHHHANGPFTLIRDVSAQVEGQVRALRRRLDEANAKLATPPGYHTLHVGERIEVFVPGKGGAEAEIYEIDGWEHHKGDVTLHAFGVGSPLDADDDGERAEP